MREINIKIVLVGAGSTSFGPPIFNDIFLSNILKGSTVVLHDINKEKLELIFELLQTENEKLNTKFKLERTIDRTKAFKDADFIINSIEVGDRMELWRQDYEIPKKHGSTQILGECGGPGGTFHAWRIIPPIVDIVKDAEKICPSAFFINFSNPLSRVCLAIKRSVKKLKFIGLCHQIAFMVKHLPTLFNKSIKELNMKVGGLNHFSFLLDLVDLSTGKDLMTSFNKNAIRYFSKHEDRFEFSTL
ncbi:MAG: alpha-glucosidase, partial [Candidatus Hodarchaeota archaeon]